METKIIAYHNSFEPIRKFNDLTVAWFTPSLHNLKGLRMINPDIKQYSYEVEINGNILTEKEARLIAKSLNINWSKFNTKLITEYEGILKTNEIKAFQTVCDGFYHKDYNPWDSQAPDVDSIIIFNPQINVKIIKQIM